MSAYRPRHAKGKRMKLFSSSWWKKAGSRALYTGIALLIPVAGQIGTGTVDWAYAVGAVALGVILSLVTSLASLPEWSGKAVAWWKAVVSRSVKTLGQSVVASIGSTVLFQNVDWASVLVTAGGAVVVTILRTILVRLPESAGDLPEGS